MGSSVAELAIQWFVTAKRDLPWRRPGTTAWGVLVSEVMLQQTPVARVAPAFEEWLHRWPSPAALAQADRADVIRAWGRLGYPRRALRLHECAKAIVTDHDGRVPDHLDQLRRLPGVGDYTARAVAVFAFGQRHAVVDTNVRRLVERAIHGRVGAARATSSEHLATVEGVLPARAAQAAQASAAFMELGALLCRARAPACPSCPLRQRCAWWRQGATDPPRSPARRVAAYPGSDRHVRGLLLALARASPGGVTQAAFDAAWPDPAARVRALNTLIEDGLVVAPSPPGDHQAPSPPGDHQAVVFCLP